MINQSQNYKDMQLHHVCVKWVKGDRGNPEKTKSTMNYFSLPKTNMIQDEIDFYEFLT